LDRQQQRSTIVHIPVSLFDEVTCHSVGSGESILSKSNGADVEMSQVDDPSPSTQSPSYNSVQNSVKVLHEEVSNIWINVSLTVFDVYTRLLILPLRCFKDQVQCFSMQVVLNKCFVLYPEKNCRRSVLSFSRKTQKQRTL